MRVRLLNRTTCQINVTADGATYYECVMRILGDIEESETVLSSSAASPKGRLSVGLPGVLGRHMLLQAMPQFHARYPDIQIDLGASDRAIDLFGDNVDCVVRAGEFADQWQRLVWPSRGCPVHGRPALPLGRPQSPLGPATPTRGRRVDEAVASRRQSIKDLGSEDFCRPHP